MAYPTIIDLPTETLNSIFGHFCLHCCHGDREGPDSYFRSSKHHQQQADERSWYLADYRQPLVSLCLVSRRLRDVAQQVLHHEFVLGYGESWRSATSSWDRRLTSFLRAAGRRADLAAAVRRVSLHPKLLEAAELGDTAAVVELRRMGRGLGLEIPDESRPPCYQGRLDRPPPRPRTPEGFYERFPLEAPICMLSRPTRITIIDEYTSDESFRERHALGLELLAILVGTLPNVERLSIQQTVVDYNTPYMSALQSVATNSRAHLLKTLDLATHDYCREHMIKVPSQAASILGLAKDTLQTLNLHMCNGFWTDPEHAPTFRSLKTLRFTDSRLSAAELRVLLSSCTGGLTSFKYEAARSLDNWGTAREFNPPEAIASLTAHAGTLKTLHLDLRQVVSGSPVPVLPASLEVFTALEDLFLSVNTLWREELGALTNEAVRSRQLPHLLPPNITSLSVAGRHRFNNLPQLSDWLLGLSSAVGEAGKLPRLRRVRCDSKFRRGLDGGLGPELGGVLRGAGVEFGYGCWPPSETTVTSGDVPQALRYGSDFTLLEDFDWEELQRE